LTPELHGRTADLVRQYDFAVPVVYHEGTFHEAEAAELSIAQILANAEAARDLHAEWINTNCNPKKGRARKSDSELATEARYLNRLGQRLQERGMRLMLHEHDPEGMAFDGANIWVTNYYGNSVTKLLASTGAVLGTFNVGTIAQWIAFDGANVWVTNSGSNTVSKL